MREYIGARYVPKLASPFDWSSEVTYEPLTIVGYNGASYTSRTSVPAGIAPTNTTYWALTGNYNGQVQELIEQVAAIPEPVFADNILDIGYPYTQSIDGILKKVRIGNTLADIPQTKHVYDAARTYSYVSSQEDFENVLRQLNEGDNNIYVYLTSGLYTLKIGNTVPVICNACVHFVGEAGAIIDLAGCVFYNVHLNIGNNLTLINTSESSGRIEGSSFVASNCSIQCNLRFRGGSAAFTGCTFEYTNLLTVGSFVDALGATIAIRNCIFSGVYPDGFSFFGCGDGGCYYFDGNNSVTATANEVYMFVSRDGTWYNEIFVRCNWINPATGERYDQTHIGGLRMRASGMRLIIHAFSGYFQYLFDENYRAFTGEMIYDTTTTVAN